MPGDSQGSYWGRGRPAEPKIVSTDHEQLRPHRLLLGWFDVLGQRGSHTAHHDPHRRGSRNQRLSPRPAEPARLAVGGMRRTVVVTKMGIITYSRRHCGDARWSGTVR